MQIIEACSAELKTFNHLVQVMSKKEVNAQFCNLCMWDYALWGHSTMKFNSHGSYYITGQRFIAIHFSLLHNK